jgi:hypothetical protein
MKTTMIKCACGASLEVAGRTEEDRTIVAAVNDWHLTPRGLAFCPACNFARNRISEITREHAQRH